MHLNIIHSVDATLWWRWIQCFFYVLIYYFVFLSLCRGERTPFTPLPWDTCYAWVCGGVMHNTNMQSETRYVNYIFAQKIRAQCARRVEYKKKTMLFIVCGPWVRGDPVVSRSVPTIVFHKHSKNRLDVLLHHRWRTIVNHSVGGHWQCCISPKLPFDGTTNHHHSSNYIYHLCVSGPWKGAIHSHTTPAHEWLDTS